MREVLLDWYPDGSSSLSAPLRQTLHALMTYADGSGVAWVSRGALAAFMGVGEQQVKRRLVDLRKAGVVGDPVSRLSPDGYRRYGHPILCPHTPSDEAWLDVVLPGV